MKDQSAKWALQQLAELGHLAETPGIDVLGFNYYSLDDQRGWDNCMAGSPHDALLNPLGLVNYRTGERRSFARDVLPGMLEALER